MNQEPQNPKQETGFGPTVGIVLIIILMIFGAIYYTMNEAKTLKTRKDEYKAALAASSTTEIIYATTTETQ